MIALGAQQEEEIRGHAEAEYPHECCGLLIGRFGTDGRKTVLEVYPISNAREEDARHNRSLILPEEYMRGERHARARQLDVVGNYHSHPDHQAVPSRFDLDHAWPTWSYVIVSVRDGRAGELRSWEMEPDRSRFNEEEVAGSQES
ncbi:MAG TPA: M67 family metallopeptidase [Pyrinomonadaceae bacterium]|nr:M67 family metallopeptidase [Pyrinomonadaceae bacterium]